MTFRVLSNSLSRFPRMLLTFAVIGMICDVVGIEVVGTFYLLIVQLRRNAARLRFSTNELYLFEHNAPDATDYRCWV
jgi:single-stranded DNA-specific DHH superfamily exonuclease